MVLEEIKNNDTFFLNDGTRFKKGILKTVETKDWPNVIGHGHEYYTSCLLLNGSEPDKKNITFRQAILFGLIILLKCLKNITNLIIVHMNNCYHF